MPARRACVCVSVPLKVAAHLEAVTAGPLLPRYACARGGKKRGADGAERPAAGAGAGEALFPGTHATYAAMARARVAQGVKEDLCGLPLLRMTNGTSVAREI